MIAARFIITSDLHQHPAKWRDLVRVVQHDRPRFVLIAGDLLPKSGGFNGQRRFFPALADHLGAMRGAGETTILTSFTEVYPQIAQVFRAPKKTASSFLKIGAIGKICG